MSKPETWPWLSEECLYSEGLDPRWCGLCGSETDLVLWQEHLQDGQDTPTAVWITLCEHCSIFHIEDHPRLYRRVGIHEPTAGALSLCLDCRWRAGTICTNPLSRYRGGEGAAKFLTYPEPTWMHVRAARGGGTKWFFHGPVTGCKVKEVHP